MQLAGSPVLNLFAQLVPATIAQTAQNMNLNNVAHQQLIANLTNVEKIIFTGVVTQLVKAS
jgi:hypothetical protein